MATKIFNGKEALQVIKCMSTFSFLMTLKRFGLKVPYAIVTDNFDICYYNEDVVEPNSK